MSRLTVPVGAIHLFQWDGWTLYELQPKAADSPLWRPFKLMVAPDLPPRWGQQRAFNLTWNPLELRMRKDRERVTLECGRPDLYGRVELTLALSRGPEWLRDVMGLSESDIETERTRLATAASERRRARRRGASQQSA